MAVGGRILAARKLFPPAICLNHRQFRSPRCNSESTEGHFHPREPWATRLNTSMNGFRAWLLFTEARQTIDPSVVQSYERAFQDGLEGLIQRSANNVPLRKTLETMRTCPIKTASGCTGWTDYIVGGLLRHCSRTVDLDGSLSYVAFRMLSPVGERGQPRQPLFDMDVNREYDVAVGNPLAARFKCSATSWACWKGSHPICCHSRTCSSRCFAARERGFNVSDLGTIQRIARGKSFIR